MIATHLKDPNKQININNFLGELEKTYQEWEIVIPLEGIVLKEIDELILGGVRIKNFTEKDAQDFSQTELPLFFVKES